MKRNNRTTQKKGIADGWLKEYGNAIYSALDLRVGLFTREAEARAGAG
jgi:hypothetical protein